MIRTQVQLTEDQARALKELSAAEGRSMADLIRASLDAFLRSRSLVDRDELRKEAIALAGRFRSGAGDLGKAHDRHLEEAFRS